MSKVLKPQRLVKGDTIGIVTPASPMIFKRLSKGIAYLETQGFKVHIGKSVHQQRGYLAGEDRQRAADLNQMFRNPEIKAIFSTRGGYGSPRILDLIDYQSIRENPKIFVGYSDITALQLAIFSQTNLITFSGPMVAVEMGKGIHQFTEEHFWKVLTSPEPIGNLRNPDGYQLRVYQKGRAKGKLLGGCLSLINSLLGTSFLPDFRDAILFIEDVGEEPYRIDRHLTQLKLAGVLAMVRGIVLGQFIDCVPVKKEEPTLTIEEIIEDLTGDLKIPVVAGLAYGHGEVKLTLPLGVEASLDTEAGELEILEGTVV